MTNAEDGNEMIEIRMAYREDPVQCKYLIFDCVTGAKIDKVVYYHWDYK